VKEDQQDRSPRLAVDGKRVLLKTLTALVERDLGVSIYRGIPLSPELLEAIEILRKAGWGKDG
jgi:hypothetical protein